MQLFSADAILFSIFFALEKHKKTPSKVAHNRPQTFFVFTDPTAQTSPELIFHIINMSRYSYVSLYVIPLLVLLTSVYDCQKWSSDMTNS